MNVNKSLASLCVPVFYSDNVKVVKAKTTILQGARAYARARNLDFTFVRVDEKVSRSDFRYVGIPSEDLQEVTSYFQYRSVQSPSTLFVN